jgi:hypothetical protein
MTLLAAPKIALTIFANFSSHLFIVYDHCVEVKSNNNFLTLFKKETERGEIIRVWLNPTSTKFELITIYDIHIYLIYLYVNKVNQILLLLQYWLNRLKN